mgnify:CR=1 FL=1
MPNTINLAEKFVPVIDGIYKKASLTSILDAQTQPDFSGVNTVKVMKVTTTGLGDYSKGNIYNGIHKIRHNIRVYGGGQAS